MDMIETANWLRAQLERCRGQWKRVATESGVPYKTIKNFMQRSDSYPRVPTMSKLQGYFEAEATSVAGSAPKAATPAPILERAEETKKSRQTTRGRWG